MSLTIDTKIDPPSLADQATQAETSRVSRPYLYQLDLFRVVTFACVVGAHVVMGSTNPMSVPANGLLVLLHYTRQGFFALTGFVLIYQYAYRPVQARSFWRKRFVPIGIPYLVWSVLYWGYSIVLDPKAESVSGALMRLGRELVLGTGWYQLYFLLVTMQVYLLFPLVLRLLRATEGHHKWVLAASGVLHLGCLWVIVHPPAFTGVAAHAWTHIYATIFPYQFYVLLGAVAAWHVDTVHAVVARYGRLLVGGAVLGCAAVELDYLRVVHHGVPPWQLSNVFLPHLMIWFLAVIAALYTLGVWLIGSGREHQMLTRIVRYGADRSFGVFLLHPFALQLVAPVIVDMVHAIGQPWGTALLYLWVLAISLALTEVIRRMPGSTWLTGRPTLRTNWPGLFSMPHSQ